MDSTFIFGEERMKIKDLRFTEKKWDFVKPFHIANNVSSSKVNIEVELVLSDGTIGLGESSSSFRVNGESGAAIFQLQKEILEMIKDLDVRDYRRVFAKLDAFSRTAPSLKAAIQFATLHAFSRLISTPVYQILGGMKDYVETDKTVSIGSLEETVHDAKEIFEAGHKVIKMKVGEDVKSDIARVLAVNDVIKGVRYVIDANTGYTPKEALRFIDAMYRNDVPVGIFEQPVPAEDFEGLKIIRQGSMYPVGADESAKTKYDVMRLIKEGAVDYVNIKLMKSGLSDALAIVEMCNSAGIGLMIGCMSESGVGVSQSVHFAAGTGAFTYHDLDSHLLLKNVDPVGFRQEKDRQYPILF